MPDTALRRLARWACALRLHDVPERVRQQAVNQVLSTLAAVYAGQDSDLGAPIAETFPSSDAALLMSSWSMVHDYDDVMLGGHTGHSAVLVPLALAGAARASGGEVLLAQIVANEIAARINMVCAVGSTRGQMATHLHLLAAAAARAKLEDLDPESFAQALAFALSYPAQALYPAFMGSDAKVLCASLAVRAGLEAVDAVRAGLEAPADPLDDPRGFFATRTRLPIREFLEGLGERWHTETNSFKIYPACGYLCSALDATLDLVREHEIAPDDIAAVDVWASVFTVGMDAHSAPYLDGPRSRISTLTFSTPFTIASAILAREFTPAQLRRSWIEDPRVWRLAQRVRSRHDMDLTLAALRGDIPVGAALRRLRPWQAAIFGWVSAATVFGASRWHRPDTYRLIAALAGIAGDDRPFDFSKSTKPLGARVEIRLAGGRVLARAVAIPRGFAGSGSDVRPLMREKFLTAAAPALGPDRARRSAALIEDLENLTPAELAPLLESPASDRARRPASPRA